MSLRVALLCLALLCAASVADDDVRAQGLRGSVANSTGHAPEGAAQATSQSTDGEVEGGAAFAAADMPGARVLFRQTDANGDGHLSRGELRSALARHGVRLSTSDFNAKFRQADSDGDGRISWGEAASAYAAYTR